ncbi:MAG: flippase-like domain-containing protein, partial [Muribaculaceae bacterium]|nr:flippase-like domain-containing protein [Muribaculaceae bacterium]
MNEDKEEIAGHDKKNPARLTLDLMLRWGLPLAMTVLLVGYMFRKVDFREMWRILSHGVDYWWILAAMLLSVVSHVVRAARWQIQLRGLGIEAGLLPLSCSIFGCYALNLLFPRLGEVWRCSYVARREQAPFTKVVGSMVADRLCDSVAVLLLTFVAFVIARPAIEAFMLKYSIGRGLVGLVSSPLFWGCVAVFAAGIWCLFRFGNELSLIRRIRSWIGNLWRGFASIGVMKGKWKFILLTFGTWGCYFVQLYLAFFAFGFTKTLCLNPGLG